jgi:hypothetical protein
MKTDTISGLKQKIIVSAWVTILLFRVILIVVVSSKNIFVQLFSENQEENGSITV